MAVTRRAWIALTSATVLVGARHASAATRSFKDQDLNGRIFDGQNLAGADFSGATLREAHFTGCNLRGASFRGADIAGTWLGGAILADVDFREVNGPWISSASTDYSHVNLEGVDIKGTALDVCNFRNARLQKSGGWGAISRCSFRGADLRGANFLNAKNYSPELPDFSGAKYDKETAWPSWLDITQTRAQLVDH